MDYIIGLVIAIVIICGLTLYPLVLLIIVNKDNTFTKIAKDRCKEMKNTHNK